MSCARARVQPFGPPRRFVASGSRAGRGLVACGLSGLLGLLGCTKDTSDSRANDAGVNAELPGAAPPVVDTARLVDSTSPPAPRASASAPVAGEVPRRAERSDVTPSDRSPRLCPPEMVQVGERLCVDRWESQLVDARSGKALSPYYPPEPKLALHLEGLWQKERLEVGDEAAQQQGVPLLPPWHGAKGLTPRARSVRGVVPQGYTSGLIASKACHAAGKRLCRAEEWRQACRGQRDKQYPYGDGQTYAAGKCNIFREAHPAAVLHGDPSSGHLDPRLNQVRVEGRPLLRKTGATSECFSVWGDDGIADMVGNLDEWVEDPEGTFLGGFYSRSKKDGCASTVSAHAFDYFDYSTGIRCCAGVDELARSIIRE